jgi:uncharacterized RDD family membrane protein YckC
MTNGVMYCNRCGTQNSALAKFCANCGTPFGLDPASAPATPEGVTPIPQGPAQPPVASPPQFVAPPPSPMYAAPAVRYGGFWIRVVAFLIDAIAVSIVVGPISVIIRVITALAGHTVAMPTAGVEAASLIITGSFNTLVGWLYSALLESSSYQATLGKMALGLKVTDLEGRRISFARATGRHFAKILSGMLLCVGFIMVGFTQRKQGLHDMVAGTLVIRAM